MSSRRCYALLTVLTAYTLGYVTRYIQDVVILYRDTHPDRSVLEP